MATNPPQQQRSVETKQAILEAAAVVFDNVGFRAARVTEIMSHAGITQGGLYWHFASKMDLARQVMMLQRDAVKLPEGQDGLQRFVDTALMLARELQTNKILRAGVRLAVEQEEIGFNDIEPYEEWVGVFSTQLTAAEKAGELLKGTDVKRVARLLVGCYTGVQHHAKIDNDRADLPERIAFLLETILPGIATAETQLKLDLSLDRRPAPAAS